MEATKLPQPVLTPAVPTNYDVMNRDGDLMVVMPHDDFHEIKIAAMSAMVTLKLLRAGDIKLEYASDVLERDIAALRAIWDIRYR
jgi:hypothetical protein